MSVMHQQANKYKDQQLAELLWPVYKESGSISAVHRWALDNNHPVTQPTLKKMADYFGWAEQRDMILKAGFAGSADQDGELDAMLTDLVALKNKIHAALQEAPLDASLHSLYGGYIGQVLKIRELKIKAKAVDKTELLIDALRGVVQFLSDSGYDQAAATIGDNLEVLAIKIKDRWEASRKQ